MVRFLLMALAVIVLIAAVLVWLGVINLTANSGGVNATVSPVEVGVETRNVAVPVPVVRPADGAAPANAAQPAPAN
jgi:uncharacterized lipoprotein NlpE involved in copper resistance